MRLFFLISVVVISFCTLGVRGGSSEEDLKGRFLSEYEPRARALERLWKNCHATAHERVNNGGKYDTTVDYEWIANDKCILVKETWNTIGDPSATTTNWHLWRPDGIFTVKPASKPGEFVLRQFRLGEFTIGDTDGPFWTLITPLMRFNRYLPDHIKNPAVRVVSFGDFVVDGKPQKQLRVRETINEFSFDTSYYLDPGSWMLDSFVLTPSDGRDKISVRLTYREGEGGRLPERWERSTIGADGRAHGAGDVEYTTFEHASPADSEFSLARFGLPEMVGLKPATRTPIYIWLLVAAAACGIIAVLARRSLPFHAINRAGVRQ